MLFVIYRDFWMQFNISITYPVFRNMILDIVFHMFPVSDHLLAYRFKIEGEFSEI